MNIILIILLVIVGVIAILLILALFTRKSYSIERKIDINRPLPEVFNYIKHLKNQQQFSKWVMADPQKKTDYKGTDGTVGFVYAWDGDKQAGKGEQEIMNIIDGKRIDVEVRFIRPFEGIAKTPFTTEQKASNQTQVTWGMTSAMKYPMNLMLLFMDMDKFLGKDLEISLANLKGILEK